MMTRALISLRAESLLSGGYTLEEVRDLIVMEYHLDEFQLEDVVPILRHLADSLDPPYKPWA